MTSLRSPEDKDQLLVQTPYGKGLVVRTRADNIREVQLLEWEKNVRSSRIAANQSGYGTRSSLMLYTASDLKSVEPQIGDDALTLYGRGRIVGIVNVVIRKKAAPSSIRDDEAASPEKEISESKVPSNSESTDENDGTSQRLTKYQVELTSWRLAGRSKVKCYLFAKDVKVIRKKKLGEMNATERVEFAQRQKVSAMTVFKKKQYQEALNLYAGAVDAVRFVQHDASSSNEIRADLVEVMVTCSNNAATCCVQLGRWPEAARFAQNAIVLLDALYGKRGMKIHTVLNRDNGLCDAKLFGEWRVKSLLITARACAEKMENEDAIDILKRARDVIGSYCNTTGENAAKGVQSEDGPTKASVKNLQHQDKEVRRLLSACIERRKGEKKREKQRAQAMFGGGKKKSVSHSNGLSDKASSSYSDEEMEGDDDMEEEKKDAAREKTVKRTGFLQGDENTPEGGKELTKKRTGRKSSLRNSGTCSDSDSLRSNLKNSVSFSDVVEEREIGSDDEGEAWYEEHKEALILLGLAGLAAASFVVLRGFKRS